MPTIALLSPCGHGNLGDAAIQDSAVAGLRAVIPGARFVGITLVPSDTARRHGIPAFPLGSQQHPKYPVVTGARGFTVTPAPVPEAPDPESPASDAPGGSAGAPGEAHPGGRADPLRALIRWTRKAPGFQHVRALRDELRHTAAAWRLLSEVDLLVVSGGGQLDEFWGGPWGHPFSLAKWTALAGLTRTPVAVLSVGTASLEHRSTRWLCRFTVARAAYRSYRDEGSRQAMWNAGSRRDARVVPDLAFAVPRTEEPPRQPGSRRIAVSPMPYRDPKVWPNTHQTVFSGYLDRLALVVERLMARGWSVVLVSSDGPDQQTVKELAARVAPADDAERGTLTTPDTNSVDAFLQETAACDAVVASRLHGVLLAMVAGTPVVALSYDRKVRALMEDMGQPHRCREIEDFDPDQVVELVADVVEAGVQGREELARSVSAARGGVEDQYLRLGTLLKRSRNAGS